MDTNETRAGRAQPGVRPDHRDPYSALFCPVHHAKPLRTPGWVQEPRMRILSDSGAHVGVQLCVGCILELTTGGIVHFILSCATACCVHLGQKYHLFAAQESSSHSLCLEIPFHPSRLRTRVSSSGKLSLTLPGISSCPHITTFTHTCTRMHTYLCP